LSRVSGVRQLLCGRQKTVRDKAKKQGQKQETGSKEHIVD